MATIQTKHNWLRRLAGIVLVLSFTFLLPWYLYSTIEGSTNSVNSIQSNNASTSDLSSSDQATSTYVDILSVPPARAIMGEKYIYDLKVEYSGTGDLKYKLISPPTWLNWDSSKKRLSGVPPRNAPVVAKILVEVTDGVVNDKQNYTLVLSKGSSESPPLQANNSTTIDPFTVQGSVNQAVLGASTTNATGKLPDTALGSWSWGIIGVIFIFLGVVVLYYYKKIVYYSYGKKMFNSSAVLRIEDDDSDNYLVIGRQKS